MNRQPLPPWRHALLALAIVTVWGTNFTVVKLALHDLPPVFFTLLRFVFVLFPACLFVRRPPVPWRMLGAYGVLIGTGQFGLMYIAMAHDISPGLASLVIQAQVFVTIGLSMRLSGEQVKPFQWAALMLAAIGLGVIMVHGGRDATPTGVILVLLAACGWASANQVAKTSGRIDMLAYVVWSSAFTIPPLLALSLVFDGWPVIRHGVGQAGLLTWAAVFWQAGANTLFGYTAWGWLLARYPAATVAPTSLLVPVFGFATSALVLGETLPFWKLGAAALVMSGLALNLLWPKLSPENRPARERG